MRIGVFRLIRLLAVLTLICAGVPAHAGFAQTVSRGELGLWQTEDNEGVFDVRPCGNGLCGRLVGMDYTGAMPTDYWGRSQCGLEMLTNFVPGEDGKWNGHILDPRSGRVYQARIWLSGDATLKLRGFILGMPLLGETRTWHRYTGKPIGAACKLPPSP